MRRTSWLSYAGLVPAVLVAVVVDARDDLGLPVVAAALLVALAPAAVRVGRLVRRNDGLQAAAEQSDERLRTLIEDVEAVVWESDEEFRVAFMSRHVEKLLGYPVARWVEEPAFWQSILHADDAWVVHHSRDATERGADHELEYRLTAADGRLVWIHERIRVSVDASGRTTRMRGVMVDWTARKEAEAGLARSLSLLRATLDATDDGIMATDVEGRITVTNAVARELWSLDADPLLMTDIKRRQAHFAAHLADPDIAYRVGAALEADVEHELSTVVDLADGRFVAASCRPQRLGDDVIGRVWFFRDVTEQARAEERLRASERRFRGSLEHLHLAALTVDAENRITFCNDYLLELTGRRQDEVLGRRFADVFAPDDEGRAAAEEFERELREGRLSRRREGRVATRYGGTRLISWTTTSLHGPDGEIVGATGIGEDITERRLAEQAIRASEARKTAILEASLDCVITANHEGVVLEFNPAAERTFGYKRAEAIGRTVADLIVPPELRARHTAALADYVRTGVPSTIGRRIETTAVRKDGSRFPVELALTRVDIPGSPVFTAFARDLSDAKRAEQALRNSEERFRALTDNALDLVTIVSEAGEILYQSRSTERILGHTPEELLGTNVAELLHPDDLAASREWLGDVLASPGSVVDFEVRMRHRNGAWRRVSGSSANLLHDPAVRGLVVNARDVTELRLSQEELLHAQKLDAVGRLAGGVAHDFNNLLTAIRGYADLMLAGLPSANPLREDAEEIASAADRAAALTRQLLAFSRRQMLRPTVFELNAVVEDVETLLRRLIGEDVELVTAFRPEAGCVRADPGQLEQVLVNLAVNARDAMSGGGTLTIETDVASLADGEHGLPGGAYTTLTVTDTGHGMDEETVSHVFEPFFTTKKPGEGTGLGLATVYGILKQSGGQIVVDSVPGSGSRFSIFLPQVTEAARGSADRASAAPHRPGTETILLVEDEDLVRALARRVLDEQGYRVLEVADPTDAVRVCQEHEGAIDVLVTDVVMPKLNGRQLAVVLQPLRPRMRVLYTSGYTNDALAHLDLAGTGDGFLAKPFTPAALLRKVRETIDGSPADRAVA
jgi:two-component system, cell cycle sensor histidine kinase and response regulator CckA